MHIATHECSDDVASYPGHFFSPTWPGYEASGDLYTNSMQVYLCLYTRCTLCMPILITLKVHDAAGLSCPQDQIMLPHTVITISLLLNNQSPDIGQFHVTYR